MKFEMPVILTWGMLFCIGCTAAAKKAQDFVDVNLAPDSGFGGRRIAQIEESLLALAREKQEPDNSTLETIGIIDGAMTMMRQDIAERVETTQTAINDSCYDLITCKLNLTHRRANLTLGHATHRECAEQESSLARHYADCLDTCATTCITSQASCDQFCEVDVPREVPSPSPSPSPTPSPHSCRFDSSQLKTDDAVGLYKEWDSNQYYGRLTSHFDSLYNTWQTRRNSCRDTRTTMQNCYAQCESTYGTSYRSKKQECTEHQYDLEAQACEEADPSCIAYRHCFGEYRRIYVTNVEAGLASEKAWCDEYRGLMRIECLLRAFNSSVLNGANLSEEMNSCQSATYDPAEENPHLRLDIWPVPAEEDCNGTWKNTSFWDNLAANDIGTFLPGSDRWVAVFYADMPNYTSWESCGAQCCTEFGPTPPDGWSPAAMNCSLCTQDAYAQGTCCSSETISNL